MENEETFDEITSGTDDSAAEEAETPAGDGGDGGEAQTDEETMDSEETKAEEAGSDGQAGEEETEPPAPGEASPELQALIQDFAKRTGLDPKDPKQWKTLRMIAEKELHIKKLEGERKGGKPEGLTEFEQALYEEEQPPAAPKTETAGPTAQGGAGAEKELEPGKFGDVGDNWKSAKDSYVAEQDAWGDDSKPPDYEMLDKIQQARFVRMAVAVLGPEFEAFQNEIAELKAQLAEVAPTVKETAARQRTAASRDFAIDQLKKVAGFETIEEMFEPDDDKTITHAGRTWPNTLFNRTYIEHADTVEAIRVSPQDPDAERLAKKAGIGASEAAQRLTFIKRYRAVKKFADLKRGSTSPEKAKQLLDAGARIAERSKKDGARQRLNAGPGASKLSSSGRAPAPDRVESLSDLLAK